MKSSKIFFLAISFIAACLVFTGTIYANDLGPRGVLGSMMKTIDEIPPSWHQILPASERFEEVMGGEAVLDKETGLVWAKNANLGGDKSWWDAIDYCRDLTIADRKGWRLPTVEELSSLLDMSIAVGSPNKIPPGVFNNVQSYYYWSSTTYEGDSDWAWGVNMIFGEVYTNNKTSHYTYYVWPVRSDN